MDEDHPLFSTFKPVGEDSTARAQPAPSTAPTHGQGAEQPPGHHSSHGRVPAPAQSLPEDDLWPERAALRAQTRLWFEQTQAQRLGPKGELPEWFHGFISRREAEQLLQDQPLGCFLVRFSESTVGFVLSYRGRDRCRHFVLDQRPDGRCSILGERRAHAALPELLQHHATAPVTPYHEFLTLPLPRARKEELRASQPPAGGAVKSPLSQEPEEPPELESPRAEHGSSREVPPSLPAKSGSRGSRSPSGSAASPEAPLYAQVHSAAARREPPEAKYQQLMCFHVYAEPREELARSAAEPIPFYAMARGWSRGAAPEENIYSEVALSQPRAPQNAVFSTLCPRARPHRRLLRSVSSQDCGRRQLPAAPGSGTQVTQQPALELDDPVYSQSTHRDQQSSATAENVYEQLPGDCP